MKEAKSGVKQESKDWIWKLWQGKTFFKTYQEFPWLFLLEIDCCYEALKTWRCPFHTYHERYIRWLSNRLWLALCHLRLQPQLLSYQKLQSNSVPKTQCFNYIWCVQCDCLKKVRNTPLELLQGSIHSRAKSIQVHWLIFPALHSSRWEFCRAFAGVKSETGPNPQVVLWDPDILLKIFLYFYLLLLKFRKLACTRTR